MTHTAAFWPVMAIEVCISKIRSSGLHILI